MISGAIKHAGWYVGTAEPDDDETISQEKLGEVVALVRLIVRC